MSWPALITSLALTLLRAAPFQWFMGAGRETLHGAAREASLGRSPLAVAYAAYRRRVGLLLVPRRARDREGARDA